MTDTSNGSAGNEPHQNTGQPDPLAGICDELRRLRGQIAEQKASVQIAQKPSDLKEGIQRMWDYNAGILQDLKQIERSLEGEPVADPEQVQKGVHDVIVKIESRLKNIRIANRHGWKVVDRLEGSANLGDTPEEDRRIQKIADEIESDRAKSVKRKFPNKSGYFTGPSPKTAHFQQGLPFQYGGPGMPGFSWAQFPQAYGGGQQYGIQRFPHYTGPAGLGQGSTSNVICYRCFMPGHTTKQCYLPGPSKAISGGKQE